jgi:hypothetical protein
VKRRVVRLWQTRLLNPRIMRRAGDPGFRYALLETTGRKSGQLRQTPVGNGARGDTFWTVAERHANAYVRLDAVYGVRTAGEVRRFGTSPMTVRIDLDPTP